MIVDAELRDVAGRCLWWPPDEALADNHQFLCHVMVYGLWNDAAIIRRRFSTNELREALAHAPAGLSICVPGIIGISARPAGAERPSRCLPGQEAATPSSKLEFNAQRV